MASSYNPIKGLNWGSTGSLPELSDIGLMLTSWGQCQAVLTMKPLTHWGRVTHKFVSNLTTIVSDNGLSPGRRQAIIYNAGILLIGPLGTNFSEILILIHTFSFIKCIWKCCLEMVAILSQPYCVNMVNVVYFKMQWDKCSGTVIRWFFSHLLTLTTLPSYN